MADGRIPIRFTQSRPPRKRKSALWRAGGSLVLFGLLLALAAAGGGFYGYHQFSVPGPLAEDKMVMIDKGIGTVEIGRRLEDAGKRPAPWAVRFSGFSCAWALRARDCT